MFNFLFETLILGIKNLHLHKLRSLLTTLGIIFGVMAVIVMVAIGEGGKQRALEQLQQLGARNILVRSTKPPESSEATGRTQRMLSYGLLRSDLALLKTLPGLSAIVPLRDTEQKVTAGDLRANANAIGTTPAIFEVINLRLSRGHRFTWLDYERQDGVCVLGSLVARQLFPYSDPLGEPILVGTAGRSSAMLRIVGVLEPTGLRPGSEGAGMMQRNLDMDVYFPLTLAQATFGDTNIRIQAGSMERKEIQLSEIWLQCEKVSEVEMMAGIASNLVLSAHAGKADVEVKAPIEILRNAEELNKVFNVIMVGIASLSLLVGGIGIMNIMLATVTERTREIGIRRALGAKRRHITLQFLIETTVVSLAGGLVGIALGAVFAAAIPWISGGSYPTRIVPLSVFVSFGVSGIIGIVFGIYPAILAAFMNPIEALRHE